MITSRQRYYKRNREACLERGQKWNQEHPESLRLSQARYREKETDEDKQDRRRIIRRYQDETRPLADNHNQPWTLDEIRYIIDHTEMTDKELAIDLKRSFFAVSSQRARIVGGR